MKNDFDKKIKNLLEDASLSDTGFELDKSAVWSTIQSKQKSKIIPFQKWISHAAAVIVGILLCLPFLLHKNKPAEQTVTIIKSIATPAQIIRDTIFIQQPIINSVNANKNNTKQEIRYVRETAHSKVLEANIPPIKNIETPTVSNPQPTIAFIEPPVHKSKVMHLLDMDNENAIPHGKKNNDSKLFNRINLASSSNDKSETISMIVGNQFFNSKN